MKNLARNNPSYCWALQKNVLTVTTKTMSYQELCKHMAEHNFKKISFEKRRSIMHVMYDAPFFLKAEELKRVMSCSKRPLIAIFRDKRFVFRKKLYLCRRNMVIFIT